MVRTLRSPLSGARQELANTVGCMLHICFWLYDDRVKLCSYVLGSKPVLRVGRDAVGRLAGVMPEHKEQAEEEKPLWWTIVQVCSTGACIMQMALQPSCSCH